MAQLSDDCFADGGRLMTLAAALDLLARRLVPVVGVERRPIAQCLGRILAEELVSPLDVPAVANSAVDGYAVRFDDLECQRETRLPVVGRATAGHPEERAFGPGEAVRVFTGAVLPAGADTVMMQEDCVAEDGFVTIRPGIRKGANRREAGEDVAAGAVALKAGARLRPQDIGLAAAVGRGELMVRSPLTVALFSTGDELVEPGRPPEFGKIYDSNRYTLAALLAELGAAVTDLGILPDRREVVRAALADAARGHDLVLTSGGVSVGEEDHVRGVVEELGALHFWRLAIKPGRPIAVGQLGRTPFVGLPGNPVAAMVTFLRFVRPMALALMGAGDIAPTFYRVRAGFEHRKKRDRREWVRARLVADPSGEPVAAKFPRDGAGILSSLVESHGLVELPEDLTRVEPGMIVDFLPFSEVSR